MEVNSPVDDVKKEIVNSLNNTKDSVECRSSINQDISEEQREVNEELGAEVKHNNNNNNNEVTEGDKKHEEIKKIESDMISTENNVNNSAKKNVGNKEGTCIEKCIIMRLLFTLVVS